MPGYEAIDLRYSADGDLMLDAGGAVLDTAISPLLSFKQEIVSRVLSSANDWEAHPWLGTNASQFVGEPINEDTMEALSSSIRHGLTVDGLVSDRDLEIMWAQWGTNSAGILLTIDVGQLSSDDGGKLEIPFVFDFEELGVVIYDN